VLGSNSCSKAVTLLDVSIPEKLVVNKFTGFSWALEQLASLPDFSRWQLVNTDAQEDCKCAPAAPRIQWHVGSNGVAVAQEDRRAAATFERAVKTRPSIFHIKPTVIGWSTWSLRINDRTCVEAADPSHIGFLSKILKVQPEEQRQRRRVLVGKRFLSVRHSTKITVMDARPGKRQAIQHHRS
jgi:hypothetical protein